ALYGSQLVGAIENLEGLREPGIAIVRPQQTVAQAMKSADPHAARVDRQQGGQAREHFTRRLVGKSNGHQAVGAGLVRLYQPSHAGGEHPRLAAACTSQNQRVLRWECYGGLLFWIETIDHAA